ncbi:MAG: ABC transporter substrate-binding protein [Candidatus Bathyarchaeia archaeon]|nr:ABC transporter substrate-binding protein [Candidatus Bathyarchaeota archaeon]
MDRRGIAFRVKVLLIVAIVVVAAILGFLTYTYLGPKELEEVRIGNIISLTGSLSAYGQPAAWAMRKAVEDVNKIGGVMVGGRRLQIRLIQYDDSSDPTKSSLLAEQLILQDKVHLLLTYGGPPVASIPVSRVADKYKIPALVDGIFEVWWSSGPYKYAWGACPVVITPVPEGDPRAGKPGYSCLGNYIWFTNMFRERTNGRVALFAPDDADGRTWYDLASKILTEAGYVVVGGERRLGQYAPGTMDFTPIIREWKDAGAEILWGLSVGADFAVMWRQAYTLGWKPKMVLDGRALKNYEDVVAIGDPKLAVGLADPFNPWHPSLPYKSIYSERAGRTNMKLAEEWTKETGKPWTEALCQYFFIETICAVIELAGSLEPEKINEAFSQVDIITMGRGRVKFIPEWHCSPGIFFVAQWTLDEKGNLKMEIVRSPDPDVKPTHEVIFPLPLP